MKQTIASSGIPRFCALCEAQRPLVRSHIIPRFFTEGAHQLRPTGKNGALQPFVDAVHTDPAMKLGRRQKGVWDTKLGMVQHLLCEECEQRFSRWEDFVRRCFYGSSSPIRLQIPIDAGPFIGIEYKRFKLFQLSILFRASVARGSYFNSVAVGEKHTERLRTMLLTDDPGPEDDYACALFRFTSTPALDRLLVQHATALDTMFFAPIVHRFEHCRLYTMIFGGFVWSFCVTSAGLPPILRHTYVKEAGHFYLSKIDAENFMSHFSQKVIKTGNYPPPEGWGRQQPPPVVRDFTVFALSD